MRKLLKKFEGLNEKSKKLISYSIGFLLCVIVLCAILSKQIGILEALFNILSSITISIMIVTIIVMIHHVIKDIHNLNNKKDDK